MIWLALNLWWILPACLLGAALLPIAFGYGIPVVRAIAKRIPVIVWQALGIIVLLSYSSDYLIGVGEKRCQAAQEAAEASADTKALGVSKEADKKAQEVTGAVTKETTEAQSNVRTEIRYLPATCPALPDSVSNTVQHEVENARNAVSAGSGNPD
jgi:uncharacterized protein (UPF0333 family)